MFRHISEKKKKKEKKNQDGVSTRANPLESPSNSRIPNIAVHFNLLHPITDDNCKWGPFVNHDGDGNEDEANKRFNEQKNNSAPAFEDLVYFLAVLGKIGTLSKASLHICFT